MNEFQLKLYTDLDNLVNSNETFFKQPYVLDGVNYIIFNYRLASYQDFCANNALECRGIMFEVDAIGQPVRLASFPPTKFFNLYENPFTMGLDLTGIEAIEHKVDGSLISTYIHQNELRLKSKGSLTSDQALNAMNWLNQPEHSQYKEDLYSLAVNQYTVNLEWMSPDNRIVIGYESPQLTILNIRNNTTGEYHYLGNTKDWLDKINPKYINNTVDTQGLDLVEFVNQIPDMVGIEGFVVRLKSGQSIKIKTKWYMSLHHTKDSINNPRRLFESVIDEGVDDLRAMFYDDPVAMDMINNMQTKVDHLYNHMVNSVESFYNENKHLERKNFAIKAQQEIDHLYFSLVMSLYLGQVPTYKEYIKSKWKLLGLKDEKVVSYTE